MNQKTDTSNKSDSVTMQGPTFFINCPNLGVINYNYSASPPKEVKDAPAEIRPEVVERQSSEKHKCMCATLQAERDAENYSLQTQPLLSRSSKTPYSSPRRRQARPSQGTPTLAVSKNPENNLQDSEFYSSPEPSSNSELPKNRTHSGGEYSIANNNNLRRAASHRARSEDEESITVTSCNGKREVIQASFTASKQLTMLIKKASVANSRERNSPAEEVSPPRTNKYPRLDSTAVQSTGATVRVSPRPSVASQGVNKNLNPSAPTSQRRSGKVVFTGSSSAAGQRDPKTKAHALQSANAKPRASGTLSPIPTSTSSRSLVSVATKAASVANAHRRQQTVRVTAFSNMANLTHSTNSMVPSRNSSLTSSESFKGNSSGSKILANRATSGKVTATLKKKISVTSAAQEESDKSRRIKSKVPSAPSKMAVGRRG